MGQSQRLSCFSSVIQPRSGPSEAPGPARTQLSSFSFSFNELQFRSPSAFQNPCFSGAPVLRLFTANYPGSAHCQPQFPPVCLCVLCVFWVSRQAATVFWVSRQAVTALPSAHSLLWLNSRGHFRSSGRALALQPPPYPQTRLAAWSAPALEWPLCVAAAGSNPSPPWAVGLGFGWHVHQGA